MGIFEIPDWEETLRIGGFGRTRTGKTAFFAANAPAPVYAIDSDKGFVRTRMAMNKRFPEISGTVISPSKDGCLVPIHIHEEAKSNIRKHNIKTVVVDSVSKIYEYNTRPAVMVGRLSVQQRKDFGYSANKAANLMNKADAIQTLTYMAAYGTNIFYVWHEKETVDMKSNDMDKIMKESMSKEERLRLMESIDIVLRFTFEKGKFAITVTPETRGYADVPNTGFTLYDEKGNYWRNSLARIYGLIYTTFSGQDEAVNWGLKTLSKEDPVELEAFYDEVKGRTNPEKPGDMWVAWMLAIEEQYNNGQKREQEKKVERPVVIEGEKIIKEPDDPPEEKKELPASVSINEAAKDNGSSVDTQGKPLTFGDGDFVREEYIADYKIYEEQFNYAPANEANLLRAKKHLGDDWISVESGVI